MEDYQQQNIFQTLNENYLDYTFVQTSEMDIDMDNEINNMFNDNDFESDFELEIDIVMLVVHYS